MRALSIAATGMNAQEQNLEVIANNVANINTTGFKRSRAEFTDLIYQTERLAGVSSRGRDATVPEGAQVGLGVRTAAIRSLQIQGALTNTGNALDLAINGRGWFQVTTPERRHRLHPRRRLQHQRPGSVGHDRRLSGDADDHHSADRHQRHRQPERHGDRDDRRPDNPQQLGQLTIANFVNEAGLQALGGNLFQQTVASGAPTVGVPGDTAFGVIQQGYLEASNVDPVTEITNLIAAQRAYEMNSKVIQAADQMSGTISNMRS